ncbi:MAG: response regulator transcription factor [Spirochaetales bacterium]|nr:response regulator transcription factor [Spirochaetales bacterium]
MKAKILIIEDEEDIAQLIGLYLEKEGMEAVLSPTAENGLEQLKKSVFNLVILDINLPGMDGFEFLQIIRKENPIPVIIVSARKADEDLILGLGIGADEFVVKPFSPKVLVARVRALLRRVSNAGEEKGSIHFGDFSLDPDAYLLFKNDKRIFLTAKEFEVLRFLVLNLGKTFSASQLYEKIWAKKYGDLATVAIHIQRIRKKIEPDPSNPVFIQNVYGAGYMFHTGSNMQNRKGHGV